MSRRGAVPLGEPVGRIERLGDRLAEGCPNKASAELARRRFVVCPRLRALDRPQGVGVGGVPPR